MNIRARRRYRRTFAHFLIENLQRFHGVFHSNQLVDFVVVDE